MLSGEQDPKNPERSATTAQRPELIALTRLGQDRRKMTYVQMTPSHWLCRFLRALPTVLLLGSVASAASCGGSSASGSTKHATDSSGDLLAITVLAMDPDARSHDQYEKLRPHTADRTLAVEITIENLLPHNGYYGTPVHDLAVVGSNSTVPRSGRQGPPLPRHGFAAGCRF